MRTVPYFERFFTFWALACHLLYVAGVFPSTFFIALIVWIGSMFHSLFVNKEYDLLYDIAMHHLPFALFVLLAARYSDPSNQPIVWMLTAAVLLCYLVANGGPRRVWLYYTDHKHYFYNRV